MEIERRHAPVPGELLDYLRANPTPPQGAEGGVHVHVHHHYAPAAPIPADHIVHQGPQQSMAHKILPYLWTALLACVVLTICAAVLATVLVVVVAVLAALALLGLVIAYVINSQTGAIAARGKAAMDAAKAEALGRKRR
ncbi:hypothetical protein [Streptomyces sp. S1D4-14]|uniref:hypothetical protein n=1 Tax=Streptomyces sp. S1D4-14 TaxID=2594461 RepID=UPI001163CD56|nr:hypothetical protein [Streptomyces sp. S1D4-14]QDN64376.1 hypothetical protein FNV66_00650 [Streptomyces sp. S1D4-14]